MPTFRENAAGLMVPDKLSRVREVWTEQEYRALDRVAKLLGQRQVGMLLECLDPACRGQGMERIRNIDGGMTLRCPHKDRVAVKGL